MKQKIVSLLVGFRIVISRLMALAALLAFSCLVAATLLLSGLRRTIYNPQFYAELLEDEKIFQITQAEAARQAISYGFYLTDPNWMPHQFNGPITPATVLLLAPEDRLVETWYSFAISFVRWENTQESILPDHTIFLQPVRDALRSPEGAEAVAPYLHKLPSCEPAEDLYHEALNTLPYCIPENSNLTPIAHSAANLLARRLPLQVSLMDLYDQGFLPASLVAQLWQFRNWYQLSGSIQRVGMKGALFFLLVFAFISTRSAVQFVQRVGTALLMSAALSFVGIILIRSVLDGWNPLIPLESLASGHDISYIFLQSALRLSEEVWLYSSYFLVLLGFLFFAFYFLIRTIIRRWNAQRESEVPGRTRTRIKRVFR